MKDGIGFLRVRVQGLSLEKMLARALDQEIELKDVSRESPKVMTLTVAARDYDRLQELCSHVGWKTEVIHVSAGGRAYRMLRRRAMLTVAAAVFLLGVWAVNLCIWRVDVRADAVIATEVYELLSARDVGVGSFKARLDPQALRAQLARELNDASWVDVRIQGVSLVVECVSARIAVPEEYGGGVRDIIASRDGVITQLLVSAGTARARIGDAVRRGQVIVAGEERTAGGETKPVAAHAQVLARVWYEGRAAIPAYEVTSTPTGREAVVNTLTTPVGSLSWPEAPDYAAFDRGVVLQPVVGAFLPVTLRREQYIEVSLSKTPREEAQAQAEAAAAAEQIAMENVPFDAQIVDKWVDYSMIEDEMLCATVVIEAVESIGMASEEAAQSPSENGGSLD
ncbi:sporulation protein YqfD [Beduinella massiliensis]|uniref:sporulation protein YqfD n=1 Tax=Beduinella massiliensis TaxID=1852363 RepID=UPI000C81B5F8